MNRSTFPLLAGPGTTAFEHSHPTMSGVMHFLPVCVATQNALLLPSSDADQHWRGVVPGEGRTERFAKPQGAPQGGKSGTWPGSRVKGRR
jgi:hypothetical protein